MAYRELFGVVFTYLGYLFEPVAQTNHHFNPSDLINYSTHFTLMQAPKMLNLAHFSLPKFNQKFVYLGLDDPPKPIERAGKKLDVKNKPNPKFSMLGSHLSWDVQATINFLRQNAEPSSIGLCAKYVRLALENGGVKIQPVPSAKLLGNSLLAVGFQEIPITSEPIVGDIVVIEPYPGGVDGHSAMFDGSIWISDFKQKALYPGASYLASTPPYRFYRKK